MKRKRKKLGEIGGAGAWRKSLAKQVNAMMAHLEAAGELTTVSASNVFDAMTRQGLRYDLLKRKYYCPR